MQNDSNKSKLWYQEPWFWGILAGPILVIPAIILTIYLAAQDADSLISDDYYREGKNIHLELKKDKFAAKQSIKAQVLINQETQTIRVFMQGYFNINDSLYLVLQHPTLSKYDQQIALHLSNANILMYEAKIKPLPPTNNWYVRIGDRSERWRIQTKWQVADGPNLLLIPKYATMPFP